MDSGNTKRKNSKNSIQPSNNDKNGSGIKKEKAEFRFCFFLLNSELLKKHLESFHFLILITFTIHKRKAFY